MQETIPQGLVVSDSRHEQEVRGKRREAAELTGRVAERELQLSQLRLQLGRFQLRYYREVGSRYVELDELRARIARRRAERVPENEDHVRDSWYRRYRADRSAREYEEFSSRSAQEPDIPAEDPKEDEAAKRLYRQIAVEIHPDRAEDEASRSCRTRLMAELNAAWERNDIPRMKAILEEWRTSPEAVSGDRGDAELLKLIRTIERLKWRLSALEVEIERLADSEMGRLQQRVRKAADRGRDLLADLAAEIDLKIELARRELDELR